MMLSVISRFIAPAMPYILVGFITTTTILAFMLDRANKKYDALVTDASMKIERAQKNVTTLETTVDGLNGEINRLLAERESDRADREARIIELARLQNELDEERRKYEDYKTRWTKVSNAKPGLLSRLINNATRKRVQFFSAATCRTDCEPDENSENSH